MEHYESLTILASLGIGLMVIGAIMVIISITARIVRAREKREGESVSPIVFNNPSITEEENGWHHVSFYLYADEEQVRRLVDDIGLIADEKRSKNCQFFNALTRIMKGS